MPELDSFQLRFCAADDNNMRLLAPAGGGKTHSLLWRCKYLYERKRGSAQFLVVTFTRAARDELRKRLGGDPAFAECRSSIEVTTLNRWGFFFADPPFFYLSRFAERYGDDLDRFIDDLEAAKEQLVQVPVDEDEERAAVTAGRATDIWSRPIHLMTALRSKGKEFDTVVMLDVNDGIWPSVHAETDRKKEQERRLFYVAMTRAKARLVMTLSGRIEQKVMVRAPFLNEAGIAP